MPGIIVSASTASFSSVEDRARGTPPLTSTFENLSDIGSLGFFLGPPALAHFRSKRVALHVGRFRLTI
jgi:hypothetical protein